MSTSTPKKEDSKDGSKLEPVQEKIQQPYLNDVSKISLYIAQTIACPSLRLSVCRHLCALQ